MNPALVAEARGRFSRADLGPSTREESSLLSGSGQRQGKKMYLVSDDLHINTRARCNSEMKKIFIGLFTPPGMEPSAETHQPGCEIPQCGAALCSRHKLLSQVTVLIKFAVLSNDHVRTASVALFTFPLPRSMIKLVPALGACELMWHHCARDLGVGSILPL